MNERLKEIFTKVPFGLILGLFLGYLGYEYYSFTSDASSDLMMKRAELTEKKKDVTQTEDKIKKANEFYRTLDQKRTEIRAMAQQLDDMKNTLSDQLDVPNFVKMVVTEAGRVGLTVQSIQPTGSKPKEYYIEDTFDLAFQGVFIQLLVFLERLSNVERIIRVDSFNIKRVGPSLATYVTVGGTIQIKAYRYLGSKADELAKSGGSGGSAQSPTGTPVPAPKAPAQGSGT